SKRHWFHPRNHASRRARAAARVRAHARMAGVSLADVADRLGHKDWATRQIYAKVQQEHRGTAVGQLTGLLPATAKPGDASLRRVPDASGARTRARGS